MFKEKGSLKSLIRKKSYKMTKHFWKAQNKTDRNENGNSWTFYNTILIDGLSRLNTSEKQIQDRVKIITQMQQRETTS